MLKPKKGFVQAQLNIERLTPIQWDGIMRAMDAYAEHYHEEQVKELNIPAVSVEVCDPHETVSVRWAHKCVKCGKIFEGQ